MTELSGFFLNTLLNSLEMSCNIWIIISPQLKLPAPAVPVQSTSHSFLMNLNWFPFKENLIFPLCPRCDVRLGRATAGTGWQFSLVSWGKLENCGGDKKICQPQGGRPFSGSLLNLWAPGRRLVHNSRPDELRTDLRTAEARSHWFHPTCRIISRITIKARGQTVSLSYWVLVLSGLHSDVSDCLCRHPWKIKNKTVHITFVLILKHFHSNT